MLFIVGVPFLITLGGCTTAESSDLATSDISAEMHVEVDGEDTHIQAVLREGGEGSNTFVQLSGEDLLSINDGDRTLQLKEESLGTFYYYTQDLTLKSAGTLFTFIFVRSVDDGAPSSTVTLPESFEITPFDEGTVVSRTSDALSLAWEPSSASDPMHIQLSGSCIEQVETDVDSDQGSYVFQPGSIPSLDGTEDESCLLKVVMSRNREGVADGGWQDSSSIQASQVRSIELTLDP